MAKIIECAKVDPSSGCQHVIRGNTEDEVLKNAMEHAKQHGIRETTPPLSLCSKPGQRSETKSKTDLVVDTALSAILDLLPGWRHLCLQARCRLARNSSNRSWHRSQRSPFTAGRSRQYRHRGRPLRSQQTYSRARGSIGYCAEPQYRAHLR
jgi:predicted small metal-binding protein